MVKDISRVGGECTTKVGALCTHFFDMRAQVKTQVENMLSKLFDFWVQTIDVSDQAVFTLKYLVFYDEEGRIISTSYPLTAAQRQSGHFLLLMITIYRDQSYSNCRISCMNFRS